MTVILGQAIYSVKMTLKREITQRQHKVELQFLGTAFPNIPKNKHTKFEVIPPSDDEVLLQKSKKCYKNEGQMGNNPKFVLRSHGCCAMQSIIFQQSCISNLKMSRL